MCAANLLIHNGLVPMPDDFGEISIDSEQDYDRDGLPDVTEINFDVTGEDGNALITVNDDGSAILPNFNECVAAHGTYVEEGLKRFYDEADDYILGFLDVIKVLPLRSDPTNEDGDGDGILDIIEKNNFINSYDEATFSVRDTSVKSETATDPLVSESILDILKSDGIEFDTEITDDMLEEITETVEGEETTKKVIRPAYTLAKENEKDIKISVNEDGTAELISETDETTDRRDFKYGYIGSDSDAFYLEAYSYTNSEDDIVNKLRINVNIRFAKGNMQLYSVDSTGKEIESESISKSNIVNAIRNKWSGIYVGTKYDFNNITNIDVSVCFNMIKEEKLKSTGLNYYARYIDYKNNDNKGTQEIRLISEDLKSTMSGSEIEEKEKSYTGNYAYVFFYDG